MPLDAPPYGAHEPPPLVLLLLGGCRPLALDGRTFAGNFWRENLDYVVQIRLCDFSN